MAHLLGVILGWFLVMAIVYGAKAFWTSVTGKKEDDTPEGKKDE